MSTHLTSKTSCTGAKTCTSAKMLWLGPSWINSHPGQKWWQTVLEIEISCSQWEASACTQSASILFYFFLCSEHVPIRFPIASRFKSVSMFYLLSQCVPIEFPSSSQSVPQDVPEALHFYMIWFASSWTFLCIYIYLYLSRKVVCFVLWLWDPLNWDASDHVLGVFGKLLTRRGAWAWFHDLWTYGAKVFEYWMIFSLKIKLN